MATSSGTDGPNSDSFLTWSPSLLHGTRSYTISGAYILAGFFVMGISACHLLSKKDIAFFNKSFRIGFGLALIFTLAEVVQGDMHAWEVAKIQPAKLAAMEALWETQTDAPDVPVPHSRTPKTNAT